MNRPEKLAPSGQAAILCAVCGGASAHVFDKDGYAISACGDCGHRETAAAHAPGDHLRAVYGDGYFFGGGAGYDDYTAEAALLRRRGRDYARLVRRHAPYGRVLDIGAAAGYLLKGFEDEGWRGTGIEPNARMCALGRDQLDLKMIEGDAETLAGRDDLAGRFDLVTMIQVIGHFHDPRAAVAGAASALRPGGHLLVEYWDRESFVAELLGRHWHEYSPPSVLHWFARKDLDRLFAGAGLAFEDGGRPGKKLAAGHAKSLLRHKLGGGALARLAMSPLALLADDTVLPYPAVDLRWALYRKKA